MKKIAFTFVSALLIVFSSCKEAKKGEESKSVDATSEATEIYSLVQDSTKVSFTAYKTTDKVPVGGMFKKINFTKTNSGETAMEALNGTEFSIPVSSLFTNDPTGTRDPKLLEFFFGVLKDTELISGVFKVEGDKSSMDVTLNGETQNIPLAYEMNGDNKIVFNGVMELENWNAMNAVASINKACEILHTGKDGVSKTWSEVAVKAEVLLTK
ncbi:YceI-like domain-containing protein [Maribacter caenipelagi]|uniref:YceI-like domain-containing protein n=1 Tax=Maribacter caenipelagi TaxID=1447781 RepID=A0A4R7D346_9FLAO|nr:YceI family protein [Maribacter caenipelagi]TDS15443.1 YceI-like domain-containing protein [Maribacter caenipelagi]